MLQVVLQDLDQVVKVLVLQVVLRIGSGSEDSGAPSGGASGSDSTQDQVQVQPVKVQVPPGGASDSGSTPGSGSSSGGSGAPGGAGGNDSPSKTADVMNQIGDGQVQQQQQTGSPKGQVAAQSQEAGVTAVADKTAANVASQVNDGQFQQTGAADSKAVGTENGETCLKSDSLSVTLKDGVLRDSKDRIGAIVAGHQFQFDGPPPQAGTIYAAGWVGCSK